MKKLAKHSLLPVLPWSLLGLALWFSMSPSVRAQTQDVQVVEITAKKYEYSSSPLHVKSGTRVQLKITATDHDHGFKIANVPDGSKPNSKPGLVVPSAQECWQLKKGETTMIEFVAQTPGTYSFRCCHTCGLGHRGMKGQIVVEQ